MEYNLKITTDDSELQGTQDLLVEIGDTALELQDDVEEAFNSDPVDQFAAATEDAAAALGAEAAAAGKAATAQGDLNKATDKGTKGNKRLGSSLLTNALRMAGFSKEARVAGAALNILNKVSLKKILSGIKSLGVSAKNVLVKGVTGLATGLKTFAINGAKSFKAVALSARSASLTIRGALIATGIGALVVLIGAIIANFDDVKKAGSGAFKNILNFVSPVLDVIKSITGSSEELGEKFNSIFGSIKETVNGLVASVRDLLSTITGGLIDSAERAAQRAAQVEREANEEALRTSKESISQIAALRDAASQKELAQAKARGASQKELDDLAIAANKDKARFLIIEANKQKEIVASLNEQFNALSKVSGASEELAEVQKRSFEARTVASKLEKQAADLAVDNAKIVEDAQAREAEAIKRANEEREETLRLEGLRKEEVQRLQDELLRSDEEVQIRRAELERDATRKRIEENVKDNDLKNELIASNDLAFLEDKASIEATFAQARLDLENSVTLNATDLKIQKINEETQARIEAIQRIFGETEKADDLILKLQKQQADKIQEIQRKARDKQKKEQAKVIKERLSVEAKKLEIARNTALASVNIERERGETEEETAQRIADEKKKIELEYQRDILASKLKFNTQLSDLDKKLLNQQIDAIDKELGETAKRDKENPFDFKKKLNAALQDLGLDGQQADAAIQAAQQFAGQLISQFEEAADARLQAAQEVVEFRNENIERLNEELANEIEINKLGLASNIGRVQEEIAEEKRLRDEALAEQEEAARVKQQIETAQQAASLLTAISQLYSSLAFLGPIGVGLATAASVALVAQFAASKVKVASITKKRKGGLVDGPSHEGGGVKYYSEDRSNVVELEGNEFVTPVKQTKKHHRFLEAMRLGAFDNIDLMQAINNPSHFESMNNAVVNYGVIKDTRTNENVVTAINKAALLNNRGLQDLQDRPTVYESNGYLYREVNKNGSKTVTKIKISK